jgi:hypothetical protein
LDRRPGAAGLDRRSLVRLRGVFCGGSGPRIVAALWQRVKKTARISPGLVDGGWFGRLFWIEFGCGGSQPPTPLMAVPAYSTHQHFASVRGEGYQGHFAPRSSPERRNRPKARSSRFLRLLRPPGLTPSRASSPHHQATNPARRLRFPRRSARRHPPFDQKRRETCALIEEDSALSALDLAPTARGGVCRRGDVCPTSGPTCQEPEPIADCA